MAAPSNDDYAGTILIGTAGTLTGTTIDATNDTPFDASEADTGTTASVWYKMPIPDGFTFDGTSSLWISLATENQLLTAMVFVMSPGSSFPPAMVGDYEVFLRTFSGSSDLSLGTSITEPDDGTIYIGIASNGFDDDFTFSWRITTPALEGVAFSPDTDALADPSWVRLDDQSGYTLSTGYTIVRGRSSNLDKTETGTATIAFRDTEGLLDPTNTTGPFYGNLDPMKQVALALQNPVTEEWQTLFRGFLAGPDHDLDMFTADRGFDQVSWQLVDAFDLFSNVILTHGVHGTIPTLTEFPNIYYQGTPSNLPGEPDIEVHVDDRIVQLLDDAGWPNTGAYREGMRDIFSGNVTVQGTVYSRKDSLLQAIFDAVDAEFPFGPATFYMSKTGVATFRGRYARFFPDRPGYGIQHWYVGTGTAAALDDTVVPLSGQLRFYRSKDDLRNASYVIPAGVDETDGGVTHYLNATSRDTFGYRSENIDGLIVSAGHDDDGNTTSAVVETNKFADYIVQNYKDPKTRVGTLRFVSRDPFSFSGAALWQFLTEVELGDVITLVTTHAGGGGFDEDWFVEQLRYQVEPASAGYPHVILEVEVSPTTFFSYNPFGDNDSGNS